MRDRIFLSHKGADKAIVRRYYDALSSAGYKPWLDEKDLAPGMNPDRGILEGFTHSDVAVFFLTKDFRDESYLRDEINYAKLQERELEGRFAIIGLVVPAESCSTPIEVPPLLRQYLWIEKSDDLSSLSEIFRTIHHFRLIRDKSGDAGIPGQLHHVSLSVKDLKLSLEFYQGVLGLRLNPERDTLDYGFGGAWFTLDDGQELHLVENSEGISSDDRSVERPYLKTHLALRVKSIRAFEKRIIDLGKADEVVKDSTLPTRYPQRYMRDPDGHIIEVNAADFLSNEER